MSEGSSTARTTNWRELVAVVVLSLTAIATAWTGFQASKWGGAMSISFSQASSARIDATRLDGVANRRQTIQVSLFTEWLRAYQDGDTQLTAFLQARFPEPLATAFPVWLNSHPLKNPDAASTPFELPEYVIPEQVQSAAADARADAKFAEALEDNQRADNYTLLVVAFATVLFLAALSSRMAGPRAQSILLSMALLGFVACAGYLLAFPKLI